MHKRKSKSINIKCQYNKAQRIIFLQFHKLNITITCNNTMIFFTEALFSFYAQHLGPIYYGTFKQLLFLLKNSFNKINLFSSNFKSYYETFNEIG